MWMEGCNLLTFGRSPLNRIFMSNIRKILFWLRSELVLNKILKIDVTEGDHVDTTFKLCKLSKKVSNEKKFLWMEIDLMNCNIL